MKDRGERKAIYTVAGKLCALGDTLPFPHSSNVKGESTGVRELRPRQGDSPYRVLYRRYGEWFVILGIASKSSFAADVRRAAGRGLEYEGAN